MRHFMFTGLLLASVATPAISQSSPDESAQGAVSVTIYNNNQALVQDVRNLNLPRGRSKQQFPDVSAQIRAETVTLSGPGIGIVEQNFDFDLLTPAKLMEKAVGQTVTLIRTNPATGAETRVRAEILAANGGVVMKIGNTIEVLRDDGLPVRVIFDRVPPNLRARPTLSITLESAGGQVPTTLSYLTPGLGWKADYVTLFDDAKQTIDVQGWITLTNNSGTDYRNANTLLVAGSPNSGGGRNSYPQWPTGTIDSAGTESNDRERLGDYYLYPLPERTTIANAQQKQVSFLDVTAAPARKVYEFTNGWLGTRDAASANSVLKFSTSRAGGLGDQLPSGIMRVYMRDKRGDPQFIGESQIEATPMGSSMSIRTGEAFDVKVKTVVEERTQSGLWGDVRIEQESQASERVSADKVEWRLNVPANGSVTVTATFDSRY